MKQFLSKLWYVFRIPAIVYAVLLAIVLVFHLIVPQNSIWHDAFLDWNNPVLMIMFVLGAWFLLRKEGRSKTIFSFTRVPGGTIMIVILMGLCIPLLSKYGIVHLIFGRPITDLGGRMPDWSNSFFWTHLAIVVVLGAVFTEVLYRGIILRRMLRVFSVVPALVMAPFLPFVVQEASRWISHVIAWCTMPVYREFYATQEGMIAWYWDYLNPVNASNPIMAAILCCVYAWTGSLWATLTLVLATAIGPYFTGNLFDSAAQNGPVAMVGVVLLLLGVLASSLVYLYKHRVPLAVVTGCDQTAKQ